MESGGESSGLYKSTDGGDSWNKMEEGLPEAFGKSGISVSRANPNKVFAIIEAEGDTGGLYRSDNAGKSWKQINKNRVLVAPFSGVLGFRQVSVGAFLNPGDAVATLVDDTEMFLDLSIPDLWLSNIYPGLTVSAVSPSLPGQTFNGELVSVDNLIDPATRSLRVRALVPNPDQKLKSGLFMSVTLFAQPRQALSVTVSAVEPLGSKSFVYVADKEGSETYAKRVEVKVGSRYGGRVEILDGLSEGQFVISEGLIRVRDGRQVRIQSSATSGSAPLVSVAPNGTSTSRAQ